MGFILEFLSKNKTNVSVIVVSFLTVVLSVKLVSPQKQLARYVLIFLGFPFPLYTHSCVVNYF
jgi:hypothetical protein